MSDRTSAAVKSKGIRRARELNWVAPVFNQAGYFQEDCCCCY